MVEVPLWLAITLKKQEKCDIIMPEWMTVGWYPRSNFIFHYVILTKLIIILSMILASLETAIEAEREQPDFQGFPFHYLEISNILLAK
jgi:hypothetical protein